MSFIRRLSKNESHVGGSILKRNNKPNLARSPSLSTLPVSSLPRRSSLKVVTLDESLHSSQKNTPVRSTSLIVSGKPGVRSEKKKSLVWKNIEIREYERVCGDNPSCSSGVPLSIGWAYNDAVILSLIDYEVNRPTRRSNHEMLMTRDHRRKMLMNEWDVHPANIAAAVRANTKIKNRRRKTVNNVGTPASKMEEVAERVKRTTKRLVFFQPTVSQETIALTEAAQKAHDQRVDMAADAQVVETAEKKSSTTTDENDGEDTFESSPTDVIFVASPDVNTNSAGSTREEPSPLSSEVRGVAVIPDDPVVKDEDNSLTKVVLIAARAAATAISNVAPPKEEAPPLAKQSAIAESSGTVMPVKADAIVSFDGSSDNKSAAKQVVRVVVPAPVFANMPCAGDKDQSTYELAMLDDDEISQLTEASRFSINAEAEERRHCLVEEANQRYILKLEEEKYLATEEKQKKSWFVISPNKNTSPRRDSSPKQCVSPKRGTSPRGSSPKQKSPATRGSSPKQRSPPKRGASKKKATVVAKKAPQRHAVIMEASDDEFST